MARKGLLVFSFIVAGTLVSSAQQGGGGGGGRGGGGGGTTTPPGGGRQDQGGVGGQQRQQDPFGRQQDPFGRREQARPIFLSGKVMLDDGNPPPEPVTIERVCNGRTTPETYTDRKGNFSFQLGGDPTLAMTDASTAGAPGGFGGFGGNRNSGVFGDGIRTTGPGQVDLSGCELRADLPGYRSDIVQLGRRSVFDRPDVGVIVLHRLGGVQGNAVSVTTLEAPKEARKSYEKAVKELRKKNPRSREPQKAIKELEKAVAEYPEYAAAWTLLGETKMQMNDPAGAREAFDKALEADPRYLKPYAPLLQLELQEQRWQEVADLSTTVLKLNPMLSDVRYYNAVANFNLGNVDEAEKSATEIQTRDQSGRYPQIHRLLGAIHAKKGNFDMAATEYRTFVQAQPESPLTEGLKRQLMEWEALGVISKQEATENQ